MLFRRFLLVLGTVALFAGIALTVLWLLRAPRETAEAPQAEVAMQAVLVAARPIAAGSLLRLEDLRWRDIPVADMPDDAFRRGETRESEFIGAVARRALASGEPIVAGLVVKPSESGFLAAVLEPGTRAVSIDVGPAEANAGLIAPGDRVDIILTQALKDEEDDKRARTVSETVLRDLRVVAVGQAISPATQPAPGETRIGAREPRVPKTITLEAGDKQAETLLVAAQLGKVHLALRSLEPYGQGDIEMIEVGPVWANEVSRALRGGPRPPAGEAAVTPPAQPVAAPAPERRRGIAIEIMRGLEIDRRCFEEGGAVDADCSAAPAR